MVRRWDAWSLFSMALGDYSWNFHHISFKRLSFGDIMGLLCLSFFLWSLACLHKPGYENFSPNLWPLLRKLAFYHA